MKNITLAVDEELLAAARLYAARRGTTLNALVREYLTQVATGDSRIAKAKAEIRAMSGSSGLAVGERNWRRDDLHDR